MKNKIYLVQHGYFGCEVNGQWLAFGFRDMNEDAVIASYDEIIKGLFYARIEYYRYVVGIIRLVREIKENHDLIQREVDAINSKYKHLKFASLSLQNPYILIVKDFLRTGWYLTANHARLSIDNPKLYAELRQSLLFLRDFYESHDDDWYESGVSYVDWEQYPENAEPAFSQAQGFYRLVRRLMVSYGGVL